VALGLAAAVPCGAVAQSATQSAPRAARALPPGYWTPAESRPILDKTLVVRLAPDLSALPANERQALDRLLEVGAIAQRLYEDSQHHQALAAHRRLVALDRERGSPAATQDLLALYDLFRGPIATTLENRRAPFLPVDSIVPGKSFYPWGATRAEIEALIERRPAERAAILHVRTIVRPAGAARVDLAALDEHPALAMLHPGLRPRLLAARQEGRGAAPAYAVPYAVAWADDTVRMFRLLYEAAALAQDTDAELAAYLRHRARDLLANDYEAGDIAWVTGRFGRLNAQIGAYETYDDELFGAKSSYSVSLLLRDEARSRELAGAIGGLQALEDALPYAAHKRVRENIPVGVYDIIADFGQARGTNTATILPNEAHTARRHGRIILMRSNILRHPDLFADKRAAWQAAVAAPHAADLILDGDFYRTLWHEIGHYLGVDLDRQGRDLGDALQENADTLEEMKADLVSLWASERLRASGYYDSGMLRGVQASGILRVLNKTRPRRAQAYQTMQLMQMNWFLDRGLLRFDADTQRLSVHYDRYHDVVGGLLKEVLALQHAGDKAAADRFIERWTRWDADLHEVLAARMRATETSRYRLVRYASLGS
jgi:hypothetical protein